MSTQTMQNQPVNTAEKVARIPASAPPVDIYETQDELLIHADFPGVAPDSVDVRFEKNQLTLVGHAQDTAGGKERRFDWRRTFVLPGGVDPDKISAELKDGVLSVRLPKRDSLKPRQIQVRGA